MQTNRLFLFLKLKSIFWGLLFITLVATATAQNKASIQLLKSNKTVDPLEQLIIYSNSKGTIKVTDSKGKTYFTAKAIPQLNFVAGGAAGKQTITLTNKKGEVIASSNFELVAKTTLDDNGKFAELFKISYNGLMNMNAAEMENKGGYSELKLNGKTYKYYVPWDLDNSNTMNGMQYFLPYGDGLTDYLRETQREDGMIWSSVRDGRKDYHHYETSYGKYFAMFNDSWAYRQPVDNHSDYYYVNMFYKHWKASGDNDWMKKTIASAAKALNYCMNDTDRWSKRFQLLKRPYCIDSWDFQIDDEYTPATPLSPTMVIVPGKTKFGVFFGDNTGYYETCNQMAEMYTALGESDKAILFKLRGENILKNLMKLSWNGKFFTHFIDEDPTVKRNLGVDEKAQIAQSNMYSLTRGLPHETNVAIIKTYQNLKENLPQGSPGEWYAIFPPFGKGFEDHNPKWQYMNGGIAGHAIGELVRGSFENGFEKYGTDVLLRTLELAKKYNNHIYFSYTGAFPTPITPIYKTVDLSTVANMDLWDKGASKSIKWMDDPRELNDMRNIPLGNQIFNTIRFNIIDPEMNQRRSVLAVSTSNKLPSSQQVIVNDTAASVYLLHSLSGSEKNKIASSITFIYADGTSTSNYIFNKKDISGWWYPAIKSNNFAGVAWKGTNPLSTGVGVCWMAIDNPFPNKKIAKLQFNASDEGGIYAVLGITLSSQPHYVKPKGPSYGGPDNWAAGNIMAGLMEGIAGIKNTSLAYENSIISPRWTSAGVDSVSVTANFAASNGYVSYKYVNDKFRKKVNLILTGSGKDTKIHFLLPDSTTTVKSVAVNNQQCSYKLSKIENSNYLDIDVCLNQVLKIEINY